MTDVLPIRLVIDGNLFAHRSYHALPKTIRRRDGNGAGAIVGFANFLLRLYDAERPRAVIVGWGHLGGAHKAPPAFSAYQSGREFDYFLIEQLKVLPEFVAACGFANAKARGFEADDPLLRRSPPRNGRGGVVLVASGDRDSFQLASDSTKILYPVRAGEMARIGPEEVRERYGVDQSRFRTSLRFAATLLTSSQGLQESGQKALLTCAALRNAGGSP